MKYNKLLVFLAGTFSITWICWWLLALLTAKSVIHYGQVPFMFLYFFGGLGPIISAYLSLSARKDGNSLAEFHLRLFQWRVNLFWYLISLVLPFGILFVADILYGVIAKGSNFGPNMNSWLMVFSLFIMMIFGGGLEEPGWRGIALPELQKKYNPLFSSLILGVIWAAWHLPLFFIKGVNQYGYNILVFSLGIMGLSLILAWIYNHTQSVLTCIIFHAAFNTAIAIGLSSILVTSSELLRGMITAILLISFGLLLAMGFPKRSAEITSSQLAQIKY